MPPKHLKEHNMDQGLSQPRLNQQQKPEEPETSKPKMYKAWNIHDPFEYAPPKSEGNQWTLLLEPLMKADKIRCDSWKAEVENLLIFAGLFSAVITAFIIESYKKLQQDPNDVIVSVLSHIAMRLDDTLNSTSSLPSPLIPQFSPPASYIRINAFWFISLVLSLTTVLVGIICLGWLREHQSYPSDSPRLNYAIFHMRAEGLERWYVHRMFTTLPLLLQCALILFLAGLIDLLQSLQNLAVLIPVSTIIGLSLLFLLVTTIVPTLQGLSLFIGSSDPCPPIQCPYKSPQSRAVHAILRPIFHLIHRYYSGLRFSAHRIRHFINQYIGVTKSIPPLKEDEFTRHILYSWKQKTWFSFDSSWLALRDAYIRRVYDRPITGFYSLGQGRHDLLPIFDIVQGLTSQSPDDSSGPAAYHAFNEISELTLSPLLSAEFPCYSDGKCHHCHQNAYLHDLLSAQQNEPDISLSDFLLFDDLLHDDHLEAEKKNVEYMLKHQNIFTFLSLSAQMNPRSWPHRHRTEIALRLMQHLYQKNYEIRSTDHPSAARPALPLCLGFGCFDADNFTSDTMNSKESLNSQIFNNTSQGILWQIADARLLLFKRISSYTRLDDVLDCTASYIPLDMCGSMFELAQLTTIRYYYSQGCITELDDAVMKAFISILSFLNEQLDIEITSRLTAADARPSLIFYAAALYAHLSTRPWRLNGQSAQPLLDTVLYTLRCTVSRYKKLTIDQGKTDDTLERRFLHTDNLYYKILEEPPFSEYWWSTYFEHSRGDIKQDDAQIPTEVSASSDYHCLPSRPTKFSSSTPNLSCINIPRPYNKGYLSAPDLTVDEAGFARHPSLWTEDNIV